MIILWPYKSIILMLNIKKKKVIIAVENAIVSLDILNTLRRKGFITERVKIKQLNNSFHDIIITDNIRALNKNENVPVIYLADENFVNIDYDKYIVLEEPFITSDLIQAVTDCLMGKSYFQAP